MADDRHGHPMEPGDAAQNGAVLFALTVAALLKEIREQRGNRFINVGALRVSGQKYPILGGQRAAGAQDLIFFHGQLRQLGRMGCDGLHITATFQRGDLCVQRSQLL